MLLAILPSPTKEEDLRPSHRYRLPGAQADRVFSFGLLLLITFFSPLLSGCPFYTPAASIQPQIALANIGTTAAQLTLLWDPPASGASQVASYAVGYRIHGTSTWNTLATIPASPQPSYTVLHSAVGNGSFDFAVSAKDTAGVTSPLHTSLDPTADPSSGWFLTWGD